MKSYLNLYVTDQERSKAFYGAVLSSEPSLHVPGMTEFVLPSGAVLGLVPEGIIKSLFGPALPDPALARGIPRAELYLPVEHRALSNGARELSPLAARGWVTPLRTRWTPTVTSSPSLAALPMHSARSDHSPERPGCGGLRGPRPTGEIRR